MYNWDAKKGGAGIEDLPSILNTAVEATLKNMNGLAAYTADKAHRCVYRLQITVLVTYFHPSNFLLEFRKKIQTF